MYGSMYNYRLIATLLHVTEVGVENIRVCVNYQYRFIQLPFWLRPQHWYFVCVTFKAALSQVTTWLDGRQLSTQTLIETPAGHAAMLTLSYDSHLGSKGTSFCGKLTQFNLWSRILGQDEIVGLAACKMNLNGDIISWDRKWTTQGVVEYKVALKDLCDASQPPRFKVFPPMCYESGVTLCESLGGVTPIPRDMAEVRTRPQREGGRSACMWRFLRSCL